MIRAVFIRHNTALFEVILCELSRLGGEEIWEVSKHLTLHGDKDEAEAAALKAARQYIAPYLGIKTQYEWVPFDQEEYERAVEVLSKIE
jgi:hypothetical protein